MKIGEGLEFSLQWTTLFGEEKTPAPGSGKVCKEFS